MLERSNCHTLDRYDFRSHKDTCGIGFGKAWKDAVEQRYRVNHWPYYKAAEPVKSCLEKSMYDSLANLSKDFSAKLKSAVAIAMVVLAVM